MKGARASGLTAILRGFALAAGATLAGMALLAAVVVFVGVPDALLTAFNQALKLAALLLGVRWAVGRGGARGFVTGATVGLLYMVAGYTLYWKLGGAVFSAAHMLWEMLLGAAVGAASGAILANLRPKNRRRARTA